MPSELSLEHQMAILAKIAQLANHAAVFEKQLADAGFAAFRPYAVSTSSFCLAGC